MIDSARCFTLEGAFSLWEQYMQFASLHTAALTNPIYSIRYEDFLAHPAAKLGEMAAFSGLTVRDGRIREIASAARIDRSYAYRGHDELRRFAAGVGPALRAHGYE